MTLPLAQISVLLVAAAAAATLTWWVHPQRPPWHSVGGSGDERWVVDEEAARTLARGGKVLWIDVRAESNFAEEHLRGAVRLAPSDWGALVFAHLDALEDHRGDPVLVYGEPGDQVLCLDVAARLRELLGMDSVYVLKGEWRNFAELTLP
jgi:rhodanese-related sulfurtransferase